MNFLSCFLYPFLSLCIGVVLPGAVLLGFFGRKNSWSIADSFFMGWLWVVVTSALLVPLVSSTIQLVNILRATTILLILSGIILSITRERRIVFLDTLWWHSKVSRAYWVIPVVVGLASLPLIVTHSLGFDDVTHLHFIERVLSGTPFQDFKNLVHPQYANYNEAWWVARYPFFGIFVSYLAFNFPGGELYSYYWVGGCLLVVSLLKIFEWVSEKSSSSTHAFALTALAALILATIGPDNYFNYCIYPLQQGKLLFLIGIIYLIKGWRRDRITYSFVFGAGLMSVAWMHHLNLLLLYGVAMPLLGIFFVVASRGRRLKLQVIAGILFVPLLVLPAAVLPETGFIRIGSIQEDLLGKIVPLEWFSISSAYAGDQVNESPSPQETSFGSIARIPLQWFTLGKYVRIYLHRVFSLEIAAILLVVFFLPGLCFSYLLWRWVALLSLLLLFSQTLLVLPRQTMAAIYRSGTFFMIADLARAENKWNHDFVYWTDPYTAMYLRLLYGVDARPLSPWQQIQLYYPFMNKGVGSYFLKGDGVTKEDQLILNSRYWGERVSQRWRGQDRLPSLELNRLICQWQDEGKGSSLGDVLRSFAALIKRQICSSVVTIKVGDIPSALGDNDSTTLGYGDKADLFRDTAMIRFQDLTKNESLEIQFFFKGDIVALLRQSYTAESTPADFFRYRFNLDVSGGENEVQIGKGSFDREGNPLEFSSVVGSPVGDHVTVTLKVKEELSHLNLLFYIKGYGQFKGNGELSRVKIKRMKEGRD